VEKRWTKKNWNISATETNHDAYGYSKVASEKFAWEFVEKLPAHQRFKVISINPALILGPALTADMVNTNIGMTTMRKILNRELPAMPRFSYCVVDVRDVARAHIAAMTSPRASGRYIVAGEAMWFNQIAQVLAKQFPMYNPPTMQLPDWLFLMFVKFGLEKTMSVETARLRLGFEVKYDASRLRTDFRDEGLDQLIPAKDTLYDTGRSIIGFGMAKPGKGTLFKLAVVGAIGALLIGIWIYSSSVQHNTFLSPLVSNMTNSL